MDRFRTLPNYRYYNDNTGVIETQYAKPLRDYTIYGNTDGVGDKTKNLLDVKSVYGDYANDDGGITFDNTDFSIIVKIVIPVEWKENTQYTFSTDYVITDSDNNGCGITVLYTDGTLKTIGWFGNGSITGDMSGTSAFTTASDKTIEKMYVGYTTRVRACNIKLMNMQLEEGTEATEYEPYGYKIPIELSGENPEQQTYKIFLNKSLGVGESISYMNDKENLPEIKLNKGTNVITVKTENKPDEVIWQYYK